MHRKTSLLGGAAAGVIIAMAAGSLAQAAPATSQDLDALKQQVAALQAALDNQAKEQETLRAQLSATQTQLQQQAATQDEQIKTIPAQVETAVAAQQASAPTPGPAPVESKTHWYDNTTVGSTAFFNLSNVSQHTDGTKIPPSGTGFDIKRLYITIDHSFNKVFSADVTTDFNYVSADSETQLYLKKAYLQAKLSDALVIRVGSADLPWVPFVEGLYGYRYVENTLIDRDKFGTSADWGVHVGGKLANGLVSYQFSAVDGAGYKAPLRSDSMDLEGRVSLFYDGVTAGVGGYVGKLGKDVYGVDTLHTANRFDAVLAYTNSRIHAGVEYFHANDWNNVLTTTSDSSDGYSIFASYAFTRKWGVFGRWDWVKPKQDSVPEEKDNYYNFGISYSPWKIIDFALVYKRDKVDDGLLSTSNGTIGGVNSGTYDEIGLFGQLKY
jgi:hypothetical protein